MANYDSTHTGAVIDAAVTKATPTTLGTSEASKCVTADASGDIILPDNDLLYFGTGSDWSLTYDEAGNDDLVFTGSDMAIESSTSAKPLVLIKNTTDDQVGAELRFVATQGGTNGVDNDVAGTISFYSNDDGTPTNQKFAQMVCKATDVTSGGEEGSLSFGVAEYDGTVTDGLVLTGQPADGEVDVTIGAGASSTATIAGDLTVTGDLAVTGAGGGITEADTWRITTSFTGAVNPITANWERPDTDGLGNLGTGVDNTTTPGTFIFPSTGLWLIEAKAYMYYSDYVAYGGIHICTTVDDSTYSDASTVHAAIPNGDNNGGYMGAFTNCIFDVTSTSTHKVQIRTTVSDANLQFNGDTNNSVTYVNFFKLGNT